MKLSSVAFAASIAAVASAQTLANFPCASACLTNSFQTTGCSPGDFSCACSNPGFVIGSANCIQRSCPPPDQQRAYGAVVAFCSANGVGIPSTFPAPPPSPTASTSSTPRGGAISTTQFSSRTASPSPTPPASSRTAGPSSTPPTPRPSGPPFAANVTSNNTRPTRPPGSIASGAERLTTGLSLVGLGIAAAYFSI